MRKFFDATLKLALVKQVPATAIGLLRCLYGIIVFQEIIFLLYFNALIFDPIPYLEVAFPLIPLFLCLWAITALCLITGLYCQTATLVNYCFWIIFVSFTPMRHDFDGGFDQFMTGLGLLLILLPVNRCFALDTLRSKLCAGKVELLQSAPKQVTILAYYLPIIIALGFMYFDSAIHKLFAEHWRNGLGGWLPSTSPYYISAVDMSWLLNIKPLQMIIGYGIFIFQFLFIFVVFFRRCRSVLLVAGIVFHTGITLSLNIYPFGLALLSCYVLLVPFSFWRWVADQLTCKKPSLTVYYDAQSTSAKRTAIMIKHFDVGKAINIKTRQSHNSPNTRLHLSGRLNAIDAHGHLHTELNAWIRILIHMRYSAILGWFLLMPGLHPLACKKYLARVNSNSQNQTKIGPAASYYDRLFEDYAQRRPKQFRYYFSKVLILILVLQLNSTLHYGVAYRLKQNLNVGGLFTPLTNASNSILVLSHTFLGITPHALYLHDHFADYNEILAITYIDNNGQEQWLPFVNQQGRLLAPNWGRVQSMWANVAVTPTIDADRLAKFIMKISAFWGTKIGLDLNQATFYIKIKKISTPFNWQYDLRNKNLQGEWQNVGLAIWQNYRFSVEFTDKIAQK